MVSVCAALSDASHVLTVVLGSQTAGVPGLFHRCRAAGNLSRGLTLKLGLLAVLQLSAFKASL